MAFGSKTAVALIFHNVKGSSKLVTCDNNLASPPEYASSHNSKEDSFNYEHSALSDKVEAA